MAAVGRVKAKLTHPLDIAGVDVIGLGGGVVDRLREQKVQVSPFNASERSTATDRSGELGFANQRSEMWWKLRELLDPTFGSTICLPPDDQLLGDLCTCKWSVTSTGKIQVESKDEVRKRLGHSTDVGDAVAEAFTVSSAEAVYVDMSPVPIARDMSGLFTPDPKWGRGPLFEEPREYPNVERIEGREADRFPGPDDPPAKRVPGGSGGVW